MRSSSANPAKPEKPVKPVSGGFKDMAAGGIVLTGSFVATSILLLIAVFMPGLFSAGAIPAILWFWGSAVAAGVLDILVSRLGLGIWLHIVIFMLTQWTGWWGRIWLMTQHQPPFLFNPRPELIRHWEWILAVALVWWTAVFYSRVLNRLSRIPKSFTKYGKAGREEGDLKPNLEPWEKDWRTWRGMVYLLMLTTVAGFMAGVPSSRAKVELITILLLAQISFGFGLMATGFYYYRRAFWKADGFRPDAKFLQIWRRGAAFCIIIPAMAGIFLPGGFRKLDQWWLTIWLNRLFRLSNREDTGNLPDLGELIWKFRQSGKPAEPGLLMAIMAYVLGIPVIILLVLGILLVLAVSVVYLLDRLRLIPKEMEKLKGFRGFLVQLYLRWLKFWRNRRAKRRLWRKNRHGDKSNTSQGSQNPGPYRSLWWGRGPKALIRRGYYRFIGHARARGFRFQSTQTPREIAAGLAPLLPGDEAALAEITAGYHEARYGPGEPALERARFFEELRRTLQGRMKGLK